MAYGFDARVWGAGARGVVLTLVVAGAVAGCTTTAQECDPRKVSNVFSALSCDVSGGFSAHLDAAREEVTAERQRLAAARQEAAAASQSNVALKNQRAGLDRQLAGQKQQNDRVRMQLSGMRVSNDREKARVEALREQLAIADRNVVTMQKGGVDAAEIARLEAENTDIHKAINIMTQRGRQE